ncbi:MAG: glycosyltransferase family 1 protein [Gemmatimonadaceae bacterium]|nr:glycosyltransferase family 1 protein [Gemmatimonadaceae bacterium]
MLRLALFTDTFTPQVNGVARTLERLVNAVEHRGGSVHVETVDVPDVAWDARVSRARSVPFWAYPQLRIAAPSVRRAVERLSRWRPTLVHATTPFGVGLAGRRAARQLGLPLVTSYHTSFSAYLKHYKLSGLDGIAWPYLRWFHNSGRVTFAPSEAVRDELEQQRFHDVRVWTRGVDTARFSPRFRSAEMRQRMGATDGTVVVAYVGRLAPEKGVHTAIEAMRQVMTARGHTVRFVLAGDGPDEARCRAMAPEGTWFAGSLSGDELSAFYASADVFVFPSATETFGNVVLEAMASGLAVIAPDAGPTTEFAHEGTALTCPTGNPAALAASVHALLDDPVKRARLQQSAVAAAKLRGWDAVWDRLMSDYHSVVDGPTYDAHTSRAQSDISRCASARSGISRVSMTSTNGARPGG